MNTGNKDNQSSDTYILESSEAEIYSADVKDNGSFVTGKQEQLVQNVVTD